MSTTQITIESGIVVPKLGPPRSASPWRAVIASMKDGDSFLLKGEDAKKASGLRSLAKKMGFMTTARSVEGGIRFWKLGPLVDQSA